MVERMTTSHPEWFERELAVRQTGGKSEYVREAVIARWIAEDEDTWVRPPPGPDGVPLRHNEIDEAVPDGGGEA